MAKYLDKDGLTYYDGKIKAVVNKKQDKLVSGQNIKTINGQSVLGTGDISLATTADITSAITGKQDKLTTGSEISIKKLQATTIGAQDNGSLTIVDPLTVSNDVYVNELEATKGVFSSGAIVQGTLTGETAHFATGVTVDGYSSFNGIFVDNSTTKPICFKRNGSIVTKVYGPTSGGGELVNVYLPGKGGTIALTSDIPTGGGGSAGVSSIGGKTGDIALGDGLAMRGNELYTSRPKFYKHFVRAKWLDPASITYQFYMTVLNTDQNDYTEFSQITVPGGCSTSITVALDSGNNNDPQHYVGCISAWMEEDVIYFYYDGMMRSVERSDANIEFISDFIEELV